MPRVVVGGDFKLLEAWEQALGNAPEVLGGMSRGMAEEALDLVQEGFATETNPYGEPWPAKKVDDGRAVLVGKTARLRRGWSIRRAGKGSFMIAPSVTYAAAHQDPQKRAGWGTRPGSYTQLPQRMMVPGSGRGLPTSWSNALESVAEDHLAAHFGKKAARRAITASGGIGFVGHKLIGFKRQFNAVALLRKLVKAVSG